MSQTLFSLENRVALVTGSSRGLGFEIAKAFWLAGGTVYLNGRFQPKLEDAIKRMGGEEGRLFPLPFDITDPEAVQHAFAQIQTQQGQLDILVNNVGIRDRRGIFEFEQAEVDLMWEVNLKAPFFLAQQAALQMREKGYGRIINMTSIAGHIARANDSVYTMLKGGLTGMTRTLAADLGQYDITVNAIAPGYFATETNAALAKLPEHQAWLEQRTSLGRWGRPEEIAGTALFLASEASSYITGHVLAVDGGYLSHW